MAILPFGEYKPDVSDLNGAHSNSILNVIARADGYGPWKAHEPFTEALSVRGRGFFFATNPVTGTIAIFAGTLDKLWKLDNTTFAWADVSLGAGTYTDLNAGAQWTFAQFNQNVVACQANADPQVFNLTSSSAFADLGGSPPKAAYVSVINRFLLLTGLSVNPNRIQWSALNDITGWTSGTDQSDFQDLPDGGDVMGSVGGELGIIIQQSAVRRMIFQPGSEIIFSIDRIANNVGCVAPYSITYVNDRIFWLSKRGFVMAGADGTVRFIGREKVDRTFLAEYDASELSLVVGASDPSTHLVLFSFKTLDSQTDGEFDKVLAYDWLLDRWTPLTFSGGFLATLSQPGFTIEGLDTIGQIAVSGAADNGSGLVRLTVASTSGMTTGDYKTVAEIVGTTEANGNWTITVVDGTTLDLEGTTFSNAYVSDGYVAGSIDDLTFSLDSVETSTLPSFAVMDASYKLAFFTGANLEATLETSEQSLIRRRLFVRGFYPITDADDLTGSVSYRENLNATPAYTTATAINGQGFVPARASTRAARAKVTIAAGDIWTFATGVDPDFSKTGKR